MKVRWLGHGAVSLVGDQGIKIVTDPYRTGHFERPDGWLKYRELSETADVVLVSHNHIDHNNVEVIKGDPVILNGEDLAEEAQEHKGVVFSAVSSFHDDQEGAIFGKNHLILFTLDGIRVCFSGDQGCELDEKQLQQIGDVDLLILLVGLLDPIGPMQYNVDEAGNKVRTAHKGYRIGVEKAEWLYERLKPKATIPIHVSNEVCSFKLASIESFVAARSNVRHVDAVEIDLQSGALPDDQILVLKPAYQ
jgi:L-ascorbate metabolism protein UlaG (beta-lactamase superfamily)